MIGRLQFADVVFRYGSTRLLEGISLELVGGEMAALLGPNGTGKSTLLQLASGVLRPVGGRIDLDGDDLGQMPGQRRASRIALVPQVLSVSFAFTVREFVMLGRTPYLHPLRGEQEADRQAVEHALEVTRVAHLADRSVLELSGGERQRAVLALALAQEPELLLLDEPTANLDVAHQVEILDLVRALNETRGLTVLAAIHDLNQAALWFKRLLVLSDGRIVADGPPRAILTPDLIGAVYGSTVHVIEHPSAGVPLIALTQNGRRRRQGTVPEADR